MKKNTFRFNWLDLIKKSPGWITGLIAFVSAVVGFIKLWQGDTSLVTTVLLVVGVGGGCLGCAYLAFKRTPPLVEGGKGTWKYHRWRPWALASMFIILLLTASGVGYYLYQQFRPPTKVIILVANFNGPEPEKYRMTETVMTSLRAALKAYDDVEVKALGQAITEAEGSAVARAEGEKHKAAIVIWGWYGMTAEVVPLSVHFEVLHPPRYMPELGPEVKGLVQTMAVAELESFTMQTRLSEEMAYLSLLTVGLVHFEGEDFEAAIVTFSQALTQTEGLMKAVEQGAIYLYRGAVYLIEGKPVQAVADFDKAIELKPDLAAAYYWRGLVHELRGEKKEAIEDFEQFLELSEDEYWREEAEEQLRELRGQ